MEARLSKIRAREKAQRQQYLRGESASKKRRPDSTRKGEPEPEDVEEQFVLDDYDSDDGKTGAKPAGSTGLSATTLELMEKLGMSFAAPKDEDDEGEDELKVINILLASSLFNVARYSIVPEPIRSSRSS